MSRGFTPEQIATVVLLVRAYFPKAEILVFGSRLHGDFKKSSDLDICLRSPTPLKLSEWSKLESDFSQSDLPFKIDVIDWSRISEEFQNIVAGGCLKIETI